MRHSDRLLTTLDEEDDSPTLGQKLLMVLLWPGSKAVEFFLGHGGAGVGGFGAGLLSLFLCLPLFLLTEIVVWGLVLAIVGNAISYIFQGHF